MDVSENLETGPLELLRKGLPIEKKSYVLHERMDGLEKSRKEWQLKPDHFTFYNTLIIFRKCPYPVQSFEPHQRNSSLCLRLAAKVQQGLAG